MINNGYEEFADYYDRLMEADYATISEVIDSFVVAERKKRGILLDLGCGTGCLCELMAKKGYDVIGVDVSERMLSKAMEKRLESGLPIQYLRQNMTELDMFGTIDVAICTLDSLNHLRNFDEVRKTFAGVSLFAEPGGLFVFDVNTLYKHEKILGNNTFVYETEDVFLVWQNFLGGDGEVEINLDIFAQTGNVYRRYCEEFAEKAYDLELIRAELLRNDFEILGVCDGYSNKKPAADCERAVFFCKKRS